MSKFDKIMLIISSVFCFCSFTLSPLYYAIKNKMTYAAACKELYVVGLFGNFKQDFKKGFKTFCSEVKKALIVIYNGVCAFIEWCKPPKEKHPYKEELDCGFRMVLADYTYAPMIPDITYYYELPSRISIGVYCKSEITPEVSQELVWHCTAVYQRYLDCNGLPFKYTVIPNIIDNKMQLDIFYCEYPEEYPLYSMACRQATYMNVERTCPPLPEQLEVKGRGVVLGYKFDNWQSSGQVVPIMWDDKRANNILVAGGTGGGKTVYIKKLLEQLLVEGASITVCDYKNFNDYGAFHGDSYAVGEDCDAMLKKFCDDFEKVRKSGVTDGKRHVLLFDEWGSYTASKSKKEYDELMKMITSVIQQGRSFLYTCILCSQRFDATDTLKGNLKEQFHVKVFMGASISTQSAISLYPNSEIKKSARLQEYCGYISTPTTDLEVIITPKVDVQALDKRIAKLSSKT